jgi:hypothetical protein
VQGGHEVRVRVVDLVAEDVQVLIAAVDGGQLGGGAERAAARASATPSVVSWSVRASSCTPARAARATTSAAGSVPSEWSEWDCRSKVGRMGSKCGGNP